MPVCDQRLFLKLLLTSALLLQGLMVTSCTEAPSRKAALSISFPALREAHSAKITPLSESAFLEPIDTALGSVWGVSAPTALTEVSCFAVFIGGPDSGLDSEACFDSSGTKTFSYGVLAGLFAPGDTASLTVQTGPARTITVVGFKKASAASCRQLATPDFHHSAYSSPLVLGRAVTDIKPGDNNVTITAQLGGARLGHCSRGVYAPACQNNSAWTTASESAVPLASSRWFQRLEAVGSDLFAIGNEFDGFRSRWMVLKASADRTAWTLSDQVELTKGHNSNPFQTAKGPSGSLYVAGNASDTTGFHSIVRRTTDAGATWSTIAKFSNSPDESLSIQNLAVDANGRVYLVMSRYTVAGGTQTWSIRQGEPSTSGFTWSDLAEYPGSTSQLIAIRALSDRLVLLSSRTLDTGRALVVSQKLNTQSTWTDVLVEESSAFNPMNLEVGTGDILYAAGSDSILGNWVLKKSTDGGITWTVADSLGSDPDASYYLSHLATGTAGVVIVSGTKTPNITGGTSEPIARVSSDSGQSWATLTLPSENGVNTNWQGAAIDPTGGYVAAISRWKQEPRVNHSAILRSATGSSWSTSQIFESTSMKNLNLKYSRAADGKLYSYGTEMSDAGQKWLINVSADDGTTWTRLDTFAPSNTSSAHPNAFVFGPAGELIIFGNLYTNEGQFAIIRVSSDSGQTWQTTGQFSSESNPIAIRLGSEILVVTQSYLDSVTRLNLRKSTDGGQSFQLTNVNFFESSQSMAPQELLSFGEGRLVLSALIYATTVQAIALVSDDGGKTWTQSMVFEQTDVSVNGFRLLPVAGALYAILPQYSNSQNRYVILKTDSSALGTHLTWTPVHTTLWSQTYRYMRDAMASPSGTISIIEGGDMAMVGGSSTLRVLRSIDGGVNWAALDPYDSLQAAGTYLAGAYHARSGALVISGRIYDGTSARDMTRVLSCAAAMVP